MNDLRHGKKPRFLEPKALDQRLESAAIAFVRVLGFEHVEAKLAFERSVALRLHVGMPEPLLIVAAGAVGLGLKGALGR